jgi:hypothetical protein
MFSLKAEHIRFSAYNAAVAGTQEPFQLVSIPSSRLRDGPADTRPISSENQRHLDGWPGIR